MENKRIVSTAVVDAYCAGERGERLAARFGVCRATICRHLRLHGIDPSVDCHRPYVCDDSFFDRIDTELKAYWLGFIAADGYVREENQSLVLALAAKDASHLTEFASAIQANHPIRQYMSSVLPSGKSFPLSRIRVCSPQMVRALVSYGVVQRKSKILPWITLQADMQHHFVRGYFDGDGSTGVTGASGDLVLSFIGSEAFLTGCEDFLVRTASVRPVCWYRRVKDVPVSMMRWTGRRNVRRIADVLYADATIWLPRKRDIIDANPPRRNFAKPRIEPKIDHGAIGRRKLTPAQREELVTRYSAGERSTDLAREYGVTPPNITALVRARGVNPRGQKRGRR